MKVFAVAGMPGAGKSTIMDRARDEGFYVIRMGDLVIEEVRSRGLEITHGVVGEMANRLRYENRAKIHGRSVPLEMFFPDRLEEMRLEGLGYWATRTVERIMEECASDVVFIDGTRGDMEVKVFRRRFNDFKLLAVHAPRKERFKRVVERKREDDIASLKGLVDRDNRELSWGLGNVIATADLMMINDCAFEKFERRIDDFFSGFMSD